MNVLLLHNNNIPLGFRIDFNVDNDVYSSQLLTYKLYDKEDKDTLKDYDTFICDKLSDYFKEKKYDLIILPFSMGEDNYPEYSGLRIATHIRLTPEWKHYATPILFIGPDTKDDVLHFSDLGDILYTYQVFTSNARTKEDLAKEIAKININADCTVPPYNEWLETSSYEQFLERIRVTPPANYATHHSIANKWAVLRWIEMFLWEEGKTPVFEDNSFQNMLYFKYLMAKAGRRERFTKRYKEKNTMTPEISNALSDKRVMYIDDEEAMWGKVLKPIFDKSNPKIVYDSYSFDKRNNTSKEELVSKIKKHIKDDYDSNGGADCYLIDLRLHDDDFQDDITSDQLSGQLIAKYIKEKINKGCPIVIFTSSNKAWNVEESVIKTGACGYVIKESPEMNYSREDSYQLFCDFSKKIRKALELSFLKDTYKELDTIKDRLDNKGIDTKSLYDGYAYLLSVEGNDNQSIIKACALFQYVFLENLITNTLAFDIDSAGSLTRNGRAIGKTDHRIVFIESSFNSHKIITDFDYFIEGRSRITPQVPPRYYLEDYDKYYDKEKSKEIFNPKPFSKIIAALLLYYKIKTEDVKITVRIGVERNTIIAHGSGDSKLTTNDLRSHFDNVILPILKKESEE